MDWLNLLAMVMLAGFPCWRRPIVYPQPSKPPITRAAPVEPPASPAPTIQSAAEKPSQPSPTVVADIEFDGTFERSGSQFAQFRLVNKSNELAGYYYTMPFGTWGCNPDLWIQRLEDKEWKTDRFDWRMCGNGVRSGVLKPGEERSFAILWKSDSRPFKASVLSFRPRWTGELVDRPLAADSLPVRRPEHVPPVIECLGLTNEGGKRVGVARLTNPTDQIATYHGPSAKMPSLLVDWPDRNKQQVFSYAEHKFPNGRHGIHVFALLPGEQQEFRFVLPNERSRFRISTELTGEPNYSPLIEVK